MPDLTQVEFQFYRPDGTPLADVTFSITLKRSGFITEAVGVVVPDSFTATTNADGMVIVPLHPSSTPYFLQLPADVVVDEDCCSGALARYKFYVPEVAVGTIVKAQDLFIAVQPSNVPYDEEAILIITEAKLASVNAAREAKDAATRAENAAQSIEGDVEQAEAAAAAANASKNDAAASATSAAVSQQASAASATSSAGFRNQAQTAANAANNSAVSASGDAGRAAASATAAAGSATTANNSKDAAAASAAAALASKNSAETAAGTATTKAGEASTSATSAAGSATTATQQANRSKTEADRAASSLATKQDANGNLTALSRLTGALGQMFYFTSGSTMATSLITTKALSILGLSNNAAIQSEIGLVMQTTRTDTTPGSLITVGGFGLGALVGVALPNNNANQALANGDYYTTSSWTGSPFPGTDGRNQGYLSVNVWNFSAYYQQVFCPITPGASGASNGGMRYRNLINNVWSDWTPYVDAYNAMTDPALNLGGLMSTTSVSGFTINKFATGLMHIQGPLGTTATLPVDTISDLSFTIPSGMFSTNFATPYVEAVPTNTFNQYGVVTAYMQSLTVLRCIVRNGPTAQTFALQLSMWGRWK